MASIETLVWITKQLNIYGYSILLISGLIGSCANLYVFYRKRLRINPCSYYILVASLFDLLNISFSVSTRLMADGFEFDPFATSSIGCRIRTYLAFVFSFCPMGCRCLTIIDRYFCTSRSVSLRNFSSKKFINRFLLFNCLLWFIIGIPILFIFDSIQINSNRVICNTLNKHFLDYFSFVVNPILYFVIPVIIIITFSSLTYRNIRNIKNLRTKQLTFMVIVETGVFVISSIPHVNTHYSLYHSHTFDCLYAYLIEGGREIGSPYVRNYHLIPFCRRRDMNEKHETTINGNIAQTITFAELKEQGITSQQLLEWFAPIDVAEGYEMNKTDFNVFHNCTLPWFGSMCQYHFPYDSSFSFGNIVESIFSKYSDFINNIHGGTCYPFLNNCNNASWPLCIDWREICDGKIDCIHGEDEQWCNKLDITTCNDDEYRCHYGGQCIPLAFAKDSRLSIDCLDGSDEQDSVEDYSLLVNPLCVNVQTFRCQERIGRYPRSFQCGDGQYTPTFNLPNRGIVCMNKRDVQYSRAILTSINYIVDNNCREAFYCALYCNRTQDIDRFPRPDMGPRASLDDRVWDEDCEPLSQHCSAEWLVIPEHPIMFGYFQLVYLTNRSVDEFKQSVAPDFVCFEAHRCPKLLDTVFTIQQINNLTCRITSTLINDIEYLHFDNLLEAYATLSNRCWQSGIEESCNNSSYFHCNQSSKCIPYHRVGDGMDDCLFSEDEQFDTCQLNDLNRFICESDLNKCLSPVAIGDGHSHCPLQEDELYIYTRNLERIVPFSVLCDNENDYFVSSLNKTETDETSCEWWPCDTPYTRCNNAWDCSNGADELNCPYSQCSWNEYECQNDLNGSIYCLSPTHLFDKYVNHCSDLYIFREIYFYNGPKNISQDYLSWSDNKCISPDLLCRNSDETQISTVICPHLASHKKLMVSSNVHLLEKNEYLCNLHYQGYISEPKHRFFTPDRFYYFPPISINYSLTINNNDNQNKKPILDLFPSLVSYCYRGIAVLTADKQNKVCLCPPNYFGNRCQWQNQRISLTLQLLWRYTTLTPHIFQLIIMLIDQNGDISPNHEQIIYIPSRDCDTKFNIYLLYPDRPKNISNNYSIRIDLFEKTNLDYWASWYLSIPFLFLPVNRIATQLSIPEIPQTISSCSLSCGEHGQCMSYINQKSLYYCQCNNGYSGIQCEIQHECNCSNDSFCLSSLICICPLYKFGSYCYLKHSICQSTNNPCQHNGLCVPNDDRINSKGFTCFCTEDYSGIRCENKNNQIDINLNDKIIKTNSFVLIHLITAFENSEHQRITILKKIPFNQRLITLYISHSFHIIFIQISTKYYLAILRERYLPSEYISTEIQSHQQCLSIDQLNNTLLEYEYLRRIKYYPLICQQYLQLMCFYDDDLMCICDRDRFSNCFLFNHTTNYDCQGHNTCQNNGKCFQNNQTCPTKSTCVCHDCYYGTKCQFSTKGFLFTLDPILAYHIKPNISIHQQPLIIQISIAISTIICILGLISCILSIIIFRRKKSREVGSGNYLLVSSITSICMIVILTVKFWHLIFSQMSLITNRSWLIVSCKSVDSLLRILLASSEWLNACVAIERIISVSKGAGFNKIKSRRWCKWVITSVFILTISTHIHDPIYSQLIDDSDADEQRIWCFIQYSSSVSSYNIFITLFHFLVPFSIHLVSAIHIIKKIASRRAVVHPEQVYQAHLQQQFRRHRHLLFAPCMLIMLSVPRLIISFIQGCMRSAREPWLYLIGYFVSFIPSILTFFVFVLPSKHYRKEFRTICHRTIRRFRSRL